MSKLVCSECGHEEPLPGHCGRPMHKEGNALWCHMGPSCKMGGSENPPTRAIPEHHGKPMNIV